MSTTTSPSTFVARQARAASEPLTAVTLGSSPQQAAGALAPRARVSTDQAVVDGVPVTDRATSRLATANSQAAAAYGASDAQRDALLASAPRDWSRGTAALDAYRAVTSTLAAPGTALRTAGTDLQL